MSGEDEQPAFAAFAVAVDDDETDLDQHHSSMKDHNNVAAFSSASSSAAAGAHGVGADLVARANEWKLRRQELHKRLEGLHQRQQLDV